MSTFEKKKAREKKVKKKILTRRKAIQTKVKKERQEEKEKREIQKVTNKIEGKTFIKDKDDRVMDQLSHNYEILKALEKEQEILKQNQENAPLLNDINAPKVGEGGKLTASADVVFLPNPEPKKENENE